MMRRYGQAPRGERVHDGAPWNYDTSASLIGARGLATLTIKGAVDTHCFDVYLERVLAPRL
jgi:hypothetical protein